MCVIAMAAKKRHMKREEVEEAMRSNSAGFFGFTVHDGKRRTIRTLDQKEMLAFFDSVGDDDPWAMHARIPSRGEKSLDNVHGWEEDGIIFCHNMTLSALDGMMDHVKWEKTDSEFFFRHVFIPFYRGCGPDAYKDGKFCEDLDNIVQHFCGTMNKFLFIMPDNKFVRYGNWVSEPDRKEGDEVAFWASNSSYKVYAPAWKGRSPDFTGRRRMGYAVDYEDYDDYYGGYSGFYAPCGVSAEREPAKKSPAVVDLTELVKTTLGDDTLARLAMCDIVAHCAMEYRSTVCPGGGTTANAEDDDVADAMTMLMPGAFTDDTYTAAVTALELLSAASSDPDIPEASRYTPEDFANDYADEFAEALMKSAGGSSGFRTAPVAPTKETVLNAVKKLDRQFRVMCRVTAMNVNWGAKTPQSFCALADVPVVTQSNTWKTAKVRSDDVLVDSEMDAETAFRGIAVLLDWLKRGEKEETAK